MQRVWNKVEKIPLLNSHCRKYVLSRKALSTRSLKTKKAGFKKVECEEIEPVQKKWEISLAGVKLWENSDKKLECKKVGC